MTDDEKERDRDIFKCHCNYQLGMGPNLQCPIHGSRENLFAGVVSQRAEKKRERARNLVIKDDLEWKVKRLEKLLKDVAKISDSRVIKTMIQQQLEPNWGSGLMEHGKVQRQN